MDGDERSEHAEEATSRVRECLTWSAATIPDQLTRETSVGAEATIQPQAPSEGQVQRVTAEDSKAWMTARQWKA